METGLDLGERELQLLRVRVRHWHALEPAPRAAAVLGLKEIDQRPHHARSIRREELGHAAHVRPRLGT